MKAQVSILKEVGARFGHGASARETQLRTDRDRRRRNGKEQKHAPNFSQNFLKDSPKLERLYR
jgi:hypothetical protein